MNQVIYYKNKVASRYIPLTKEFITMRIRESGNYWVSEKIDGHFAALHVANGQAALYSRNGKKLEATLLLKEAANVLAGKNLLVAGELYADNGKQRMRSYEVSSALSENSEQLRFAPFDIIEEDAKPYQADTQTTLEKIKALFSASKLLAPVPQHPVKEAPEIVKWYNELVEEKGAEGIVVRSDGFTAKIKTKHHLDVVVLGYTEGEDHRAGMLRDVLVGVRNSEDTWQVLGKVGGGFSEEMRVKLLARFATMHVESEYIEIAEGSIAFQMIRPEVVMEISCLDMVSEFSGKTVRKMELRYASPQGYTPVSLNAWVSLISPNFESLREDKSANQDDAGRSQITREVEISTEEKTANLGKSEVLRREVYVKITKGAKAVRKFVAWKTNKEDSGQYPPYVILFTDFSANRKEMLEQEIKTALTEKELMDTFDQWTIENAKTGWNKV
ncbi:MAG: hypothetical protein MUF42_08685 [Cytophagaceae bacterium]|jgi:ATP-dependent DNA ligase|nr:hypothetical protein [Cytophagaceae bacterium]